MATTARKSSTWKVKGWTAIPNSIIRTKDLTLEHKGLIAWIASHDDEFEFTLQRIAECVGAGRNKIEKLVKDLERMGLLTRTRTRERGLITGVVYELHPEPVPASQNTAQPSRKGANQARRPSKMIKEVAGQNHFPTVHEEANHFPTVQELDGHEEAYKEEKTNKKNPSPYPSRDGAAPSDPATGREGVPEQQIKINDCASEIVASLPAIRGQRPGVSLAVKITTRLDRGWDRQAIVDELTRDLGTANGVGVYHARVDAMPEQPPRTPTKKTIVHTKHAWIDGGANGACKKCGSPETSAIHRQNPIKRKPARTCEHGRIVHNCSTCRNTTSRESLSV